MKLAWLPLAMMLLLVVTLFALGNGTLEITPTQAFDAILKGLRGQALEGLELIVWQVRLPRVVFALLVGASLALSGVAMQGVFQNPLADPYLVGVASGASFGATVAIFLTSSAAPGFASGLFMAASGNALVPGFAFLGALLTVSATVALAQAAGRGRSGLILAGVVVGSTVTAITTLLQLFDADRLRAVFAWSLGNLALAGWSEVQTVLPAALLGALMLWAFSKPLDALQLGEQTAQTLGVRVLWLKLAVIAAASLMTAAAVSFAGIIGFVGLVAPHLMRLLVGPAHRPLMLGSALFGAGLLVLSDLGARTLIRPQELPVGVLTTLIGGPFFLWLLWRNQT